MADIIFERTVPLEQLRSEPELAYEENPRPGPYAVWIYGYDSGIFFVVFQNLNSARWWVEREIKRIAKEFTAIPYEGVLVRKWAENDMVDFRGCNDFGWRIEKIHEGYPFGSLQRAIFESKGEVEEDV
jgi:hypothetical protein